VQLYRYLRCFSTSVCYCCCCLFRYRLSPETFGHTIVLSLNSSHINSSLTGLLHVIVFYFQNTYHFSWLYITLLLHPYLCMHLHVVFIFWPCSLGIFLFFAASRTGVHITNIASYPIGSGSPSPEGEADEKRNRLFCQTTRSYTSTSPYA
jgi:hypothetical protein